ncbi:hypothetical protein [Ancylobacter rudongensis]|uniref:Uncharacterized protein n=1 Tax=Ancylobacter rudongensis TaxID=177413 RepID=A0A1G4U9V0_9HYPH|nr:hypothetical protein [Ancylobacter rudongensis]SCW90347.1 hypothetical protein SAMN05660859_3604 [Ancylobacter rudongensis]
MRTTKLIAAALLASTFALPAAAQTQPQNPNAKPSAFPWLRTYATPERAANRAALNGDAAIRWQETINAYAHR